MRSRSIALTLSVVLVTTLVQAVAGPAAFGQTGPSVPLPPTPSTPVTAPSLETLNQDQASRNELRNDQGPKQTAPDGHGTTAATSLAPSASWTVASHTGDFSWSYPLRVPPAPGSLVPNLALSYRSSEVDGRTSATNNQPSWAGEGWNLSPGFVERTYGACGDDDMGDVKPPQEMADLCWRSDNATASYGGSGGPLIRDGGSDNWRTKSDDGSRIERREGTDNDDNNGEYWVITAVDGTQYWFGSEKDSKSTWTVPVYGDDDNEPCKADTLAASHCVQAYRWLLDKVIDRNGNMMRYYYRTETNKYGQNQQETAVEYVRGGTLERIDYGLRDTVTTPSGRILFGIDDRCVPGSDCVESKKDNWPDVAWDNKCDATPCKVHHPSFWSTKRLASVTTQVSRGTAFDDVDRWDLEHSFPNPGDSEKASLWLKSLKHTGLVGDGTAVQPPVTFEGTALPNRVDTAADGVSPMYRYRITGVRTESGGLVSITYTSQCTPGTLPAKPEENTQWCFPVKWALKNHAERTDYFHKYMVTKVITSDRLRVQNDQKLSSPEQVVSYEYLDGAAWHWDTSEFTKDKTYNEFRGFGRVRTRIGAPDELSGKMTMSEERFYRGMDGDKLPNGTRSVTVEDSELTDYTDSDWLRGFGYESAQFAYEAPTVADRPDPPRIAKSIIVPDVQGPTATRGDLKAYIVRTGTQRSYTALSSGGWRITETDSDYNDRGLLTKVSDLGDVSTAQDDRCTINTYAPNTSKWIIGLISREEIVSVKCGEPLVFPRDALSDTRNTFDDNGNITKAEILTDRPEAGPVYLTVSTTEYDDHGRVETVKDAAGRTTTTAYTPALGGPLTQTMITSPAPKVGSAGLTTTTAYDPAWGMPVKITDPNGRVTTTAYDAAGRKTMVWLPNRPTNEKPSVKYSYLIRDDGASVVSTTRLGPKNTEITSKTLYDGLLRPRQSQSPAMGGGRLITDIRYDSLGRQWMKSQPYFNTGEVDDILWLASDAEMPGHTRSYYDDAGRLSASVYFAGAHEQRRSTITYGGDRVHNMPPSGATPVTSITDARGQVVERRRYHGPKPEGAYDATLYTYTKGGQLATVTDPMDKVWRYTHDLRGRLVTSEDPDSGTSTVSYDDLNRRTSGRDGRGETVAFEYDNLDRPIATYAGQIGGTKLTEWTYDTAFKGVGKLASSTRWVDGQAYTRKVISYNQLYQPTGTTLTIPAREGLLARTYTSLASYNVDGSVSSQTYDKAGELPAEGVSYKYDHLGPILESSGGYNGSTFLYGTATEYTRYGELQRVQLGPTGKHVWQSYYYDTNNRRLIRSVVDAQVPAPMQSDTKYTYTPAGTITSVADVPQGQQPADIQCFQQDYLLRTTQAWTAKAADWSADEGCKAEPSLAGLDGPAPYWHSYTYDKSGNRTAEVQHSSTGDTERSYTYDVAGHGHALNAVTTKKNGVTTREEYQYNAGGAVTRKGDQEFTWNVEGKLAGVKKDGKDTSFIYDAEGNRLIRRDPEGTTLYLPGQELRLNVNGGNPTVTRYYSHGGRIVAARQGNGTLTWLVGDHQGTGQIAINAGTLEVTRRRHLPFGGSRGTAVQWPTDHGFVGGVEDDSTGLTHLGARDYDPSTGRFVSVDPMLDLADAQQLNGYTYSNNNPVTFSDPAGTYCDSCDFYGRQDEQRGGSGSVWTPVAPGQPTKPNAPAGYGPAAAKAERAMIIDGRNKDRSKQPILFDRPIPTFEDLRALRLAHRGYADDEYDDAVRDWAKHVCRRAVGNEGFCSYVQDLGALDRDKSPIAELAVGMMPVAGAGQSAAECATGESSCWWLLADLPLLSVLKALKVGKIAAKPVAKACSFTGETKVVMADGTVKPIAEVKIGDEVLAADPQSGTTMAKAVKALIQHRDSVLDLVTEDGAKVTTTEDHPFWNETDRQWQRADRFDRGDSLLTSSGGRVAFGSLRADTRRFAVAYNLSVKDLRSYYVLIGADPVLVHNDDLCLVGEAGDVVSTVDGPIHTITVSEGTVIRGDVHGTVHIRGGAVLEGNVYGTLIMTGGSGSTLKGNVYGTVIQVGKFGPYSGNVMNNYGPHPGERPDGVFNHIEPGPTSAGTIMQIGTLQGSIIFGLTE
ncbi:RHS repeat-associated core domain-containing protein [Kibdelosporangium aridum]|uniref:RHS repeat-associated core domain-containing protein n=1 Tax=Kibdelosporangium aridum TaxID=2030 RepID=UPI000689DF77|nr:RHS repeat-associated core domain-containing protein [Kibdelosporangium aridum]